MMYLIFLIATLRSVFAQEMLEAVQVTASKDVERFTFATTEKITDSDLEGEPLGLVAGAIAKIPGVIAAENGGPGGRVSFFIRGTESRHVSFTLDGLKINDTSNTDRQFDAAFMMSPFLREIFIHKGPQAVLYGSDALGGVVEFRTRKGESAPESRLTLNAGSFGSFDSSLSSDWNRTGHQGTLTVSRFHSDGISRLNRKRFGATEADSTDITQLTSSTTHKWSERSGSDILLSYLTGKAEQDGFASDNNFDFSRNDQFIAQQKTNLLVGSTQAIAFRTGFNRHQRLNVAQTSGKEFFNGNLIQNELIHRLEKPHFGFLSGISTEQESANAIELDRSFDLHSVFTQGSIELGRFSSHGGVRADRHSRYGSFYTGSAGLGFSDFSLQYSQGYKAPSLYQLYGPSSFGAPVGNSSLVPERSHSLEVAWKKKSENWEADLVIFQNRLSNQFTYSFTRGYLNQQRYITEGVEGRGKLSLGNSVLALSLTHQNFREEQSTVLRRPYNMAQVSYSCFPKESLELNISQRWFSSRRDFGSGGDVTKLNGYEVIDVAVRKHWGRDEVGAQVKNLLNRRYEELYGFNTMPASIFVHFGHKF